MDRPVPWSVRLEDGAFIEGAFGTAANINTLSGPVSLLGDSATLTGVADINLAGPVSGDGTLLKTGTGTAYLKGTNTHAGITVAAGAVVIAIPPAPAVIPAVTLAPASPALTVRLTGAAPAALAALSGTGSLVRETPGTLAVTGAVTPRSGDINLSGVTALSGVYNIGFGLHGILTSAGSLDVSGLLLNVTDLAVIRAATGALSGRPGVTPATAAAGFIPVLADSDTALLLNRVPPGTLLLVQ
jgi:autotransporter-associated beta strand protein